MLDWGSLFPDERSILASCIFHPRYALPVRFQLFADRSDVPQSVPAEDPPGLVTCPAGLGIRPGHPRCADRHVQFGHGFYHSKSEDQTFVSFMGWILRK